MTLLAALHLAVLISPPPWHSDFATARAEALKTGRPILAVLH
jgi:hypothetical protein